MLGVIFDSFSQRGTRLEKNAFFSKSQQTETPQKPEGFRNKMYDSKQTIKSVMYQK
jgi:hypothetical protein